MRILLSLALIFSAIIARANVPAISLKGTIIEITGTGFRRPSDWIYITPDGKARSLASGDVFNQTGISGPDREFSETFDSEDPAVLQTSLGSFKFITESSGIMAAYTFQVYFPYPVEGPVNVSNRAYVTPGRVSITGFVTQGDWRKLYLIRSLATSLQRFQVDSTDSVNFEIYNDSLLYLSMPFTNDQLSGINALAGAFPSSEGASEAFRFLALDSGAYTVVARGGTKSGDLLTEVYELGFGTKRPVN